MTRRSMVLALVTLLCASSAATAAPADFGERISTDSANIVFGPVDGDALLDAAEVDSNSPGKIDIVYRLHGPEGVFGLDKPAGTADVQDFETVRLAIADPMDDSPRGLPRRNDIVVGLVGARDEIKISLQGPGGFEAQDPIPVSGLGAAEFSNGSFQRRITGSGAGDVTGDGRADAIFTLSDFAGDSAEWHDRVVVVTSVRGTPRTLLSRKLPLDATASGVSLFDVSDDDDGVLDIVSAGSEVGFVTATGGRIGDWERLPVNLGSIWDHAIGHFNGDGLPDLVVLQAPTPETAHFYLLLSRPGGSYEYAPLIDPLITPQGDPCSVGSGHLNKDGLPDLVLRWCRETNTPEPAMALLGDGRGGFSKLTVVEALGGRRGADIIDLNGDGFGDLVFTGGGDSSTVVYMNRGIFDPCPGCGTPPGGGGGGGGGGGSGTATIQSTSRAPALGVALKARRWNPRRPLRFRVGCDERCQVTVSSTLSFTSGAKGRVLQAIPLKTQVLSLTADRSARVTLELRPASIRLVRRLLGRGLVGRVAVKIRATDSSGNASQWGGAVPLRRPPR